MHAHTLLGEKDHSLLLALSQPRTAEPYPPTDPHRLLAQLLETAPCSDDDVALARRVELGDTVLLVSADDSSDTYEPAIVLPSEADLQFDRLSVLTPIGLALIGKPLGHLAAWETPHGSRQMKITSIRKLSSVPSPL